VAVTESTVVDAVQPCLGKRIVEEAEAAEAEAPQPAPVDDAAAPEESKSADTEAGGAEAQGQISPDAAMAPAEAEVADAVAPAGSKAPKASAGIKRKVGMTVEVLELKIKRLQDEADKEDKEAAVLEAEIAAKRDVAACKRAEARKVAQEHARVFREAALAKVEASMRKKPSNAWFMFTAEVMPKTEAESISARTKKVSEMWRNMSAEEKQKYKDKFDEENKKYLQWAASEEGRKLLHERGQILLECKATSERTLGAAAGVPQVVLESPVKQRRVELAKAPQAAEPALDEKVLQEAEQLSMRSQFCNLAGRPDIIALKRSPQELLNALKASNGMVNVAKRTLLGE